MLAAPAPVVQTPGVPFDVANKTYSDALQVLPRVCMIGHGPRVTCSAGARQAAVMAPLIAGGLDIAWTDWQQGFPGVGAVRGLVPTAMLNHVRFYK